MLWRQRRWRLLLNLIEGLPRDSCYIEAFVQDEDAAGQILDAADGTEDSRPVRRMSEWSPAVEELAYIGDRVTELIQITVAARGRRPAKVPARPRPRTALERVRYRRAKSRHNWIVARAFGRAGPETKPPPG